MGCKGVSYDHALTAGFRKVPEAMSLADDRPPGGTLIKHIACGQDNMACKV